MENNKDKEIINNYGVVAENIDNVTVNLPIHKIKNSILASFLEKLIENKAFETNSDAHSIIYDIREKLDYNNVIKYILLTILRQQIESLTSLYPYSALT